MAASGALREIFALFELGVDSEELERGAKHLEGFLGKVKHVGAVVAEAFAVNLIKEFFQEQIEGAAHIQDLSERLDVSAESLHEFGMVAKSAGVDLDTAAHQLGFLQAALGKAALEGGANAAAFQKLGVHTKDASGKAKDLMEIIPDIAEGLSRLPDQSQRAAYAMQLFGREGKALLPILSQDKEKLMEMLQEAHELSGGLGDDYFEASKKAREEGERFGFAIEAVKMRLTNLLLPGITAILVKLKDLGIGFLEFIKHTYVLQTGLTFLSVLLGGKLLMTLGGVLKALKLIKPTVGETVAAFAEFLLPVLILAGLYFAFDELYTLMHGGKTIIGETVDSLLGIGTATQLALWLNGALEDTIRFFKDIGAVVAGVTIPVIMNLFHIVEGLVKAMYDVASMDPTKAWKDVKQIGTDIKADWVAGLHEVKNAGADLFGGPQTKSGFGHGAGGGQFTALEDKGVKPEDILKNFNSKEGFNPSLLLKNAAAATAATAVAPKTTAAHGKHGARPTHVSQNNTFNTHVHTSSDNPEAINKATGAGLAKPMEKATNNALQAVKTF